MAVSLSFTGEPYRLYSHDCEQPVASKMGRNQKGHPMKGKRIKMTSDMGYALGCLFVVLFLIVGFVVLLLVVVLVTVLR